MNIIYVILCHLFGDYVLQSEYIATTKGKNWYHLFVHCALYCVPFILIFGLDWRVLVIFTSHIVIDSLKARWSVINYTQDQVVHYVIGMVCYLII